MLKIIPLLGFLICLSACSSTPDIEYVGAPVSIVDTHEAYYTIVSASFNGSGGYRGTGICCTLLPRHWVPGSTATIEWVKDPSPKYNPGRIPMPSSDSKEWKQWYEIHAANYTKHSVTIPMPEYKKSAGVILFFLPCDEVRAVIDSKEQGRILGNVDGPFNQVVQERLGFKKECKE
ncbi:DUF3304 domain-containing protein [Iodobacter sp. LRB]|uniref:DUF3304 domain-containing protein n=1 Tax=unclassified Iodobacter TaxID=235634 RepID=UPI000C0E847F|nr:DUF3304 domain-containing protein [Iodobacter sp. BJB302]PHV01022.1 hypothetical protein CSQ88_14425 [Iodobacter sp. BJB302]